MISAITVLALWCIAGPGFIFVTVSVLADRARQRRTG